MTDADSVGAERLETSVRGRTLAATLVVLALLPLAFDMSSTYIAGLLVRFLLFATFAVALNIVFGHTNQLFLFVGALSGVGAYTTVLLADYAGVSPWVTLPLAGFVAGTIGMIVSYVAARRRMTVIVIAILTLSIQLGLNQIFVGAREVTGGSTGTSFGGFELGFLASTLGLGDEVATYYLAFAVLAGTLALYWWMRNSRFGLAFNAIRQDEIASEAAGIDVIRYKVAAGFAGAAIIGLVGPIYAHSESYILPTMFAFQTVDVVVLIMLVLGGMRTFTGPLLGAALLVVVNELLQGAGQWRTALLGGLLIVLFIYFRDGLVPPVQDALGDRSVGSSLSSIFHR